MIKNRFEFMGHSIVEVENENLGISTAIGFMPDEIPTLYGMAPWAVVPYDAAILTEAANKIDEATKNSQERYNHRCVFESIIRRVPVLGTVLTFNTGLFQTGNLVDEKGDDAPFYFLAHGEFDPNEAEQFILDVQKYEQIIAEWLNMARALLPEDHDFKELAEKAFELMVEDSKQSILPGMADL